MATTKLLTFGEVRRLLDVCERTLQNWCQSGKIKFDWLGSRRVFDADEIERVKRQRILRGTHAPKPKYSGSARLLDAEYEISGPAGVRDFLISHPEVKPLLHEARSVIDRHFPDAPATLKVMVDPEIPNREDMLVGIVSRWPVDEAIARLDAFDEDWWLKVPDGVGDLVCINLEFR